ncbi:phenylalanine--tRNA ligase subunit alpha [Flavobacteriales bacterium]|nr:phenylalanine--tRNA ligase subunit alpha [Flavobacteriales bacterium]MDC1370322.1 phenylalanine--tRNA ligase subunit alpha [Flavobacteriales bacterium]
MKDRIEQLLEEVSAFKASKLDEVEQLRIKILGKKGELKELFNSFKTVANDQKKEVGLLLNKLRNKTEEKIIELSSSFAQKEDEGDSFLDLSLPISDDNLGSRHPLSIVKNEIIEIFSRIGYSISEGPEIEDDWHNFSALNFPKEHPARDMQDTFFIDKENALRTHTSSVQVRVMGNSTPPIRTISPGRVFRNEAISARAHCIFHQVEGLYIDKNVSFADLKQTLLYFAKEMFGDKTEIRLRPSYFPFTEPSAEVDVSCIICSGKGCNVCKHTGFLEILGCGMVDPNVLENCGIDSKVYTGFAFGMGVERIAMLKYQINDLRMFFENDVRFLNQFKSTI